MKHTPGPWREGKTSDVIVADIPDPIENYSGYKQDFFRCCGGFVIAESVLPHNKPLIAAAPDLYEALWALLDEQNGVPLLRRERQYNEACEMARTAIAKAEGRKLSE